jgi:DNA-binding CsgD family transcriptional regulator
MRDHWKNHLSRNDMSGLLALSESSLKCTSEDQFRKLVLDMQSLFGFENAICTQSEIPDSFLDRDADVSVLDISYPKGFTQIYFENRYHLVDTVLCAAMTHLTPMTWSEILRKPGRDPANALAYDFGMKEGWAHCAVEPGTMRCTMFFMAGETIESGIRVRKIIDYIIPFFSMTYAKVLKKSNPPLCRLTSKEIEVLRWLKEGKSSWEISVILHCSKRVIDFHVSNLKTKLNAVSRAQCVATGIRDGIIDI